ncbi:MAG: hypothetical protein VYD19_07015, partial [Myxococcota bacterium]|nr:hypothetical protein [Myxococcota bacterium]
MSSVYQLIKLYAAARNRSRRIGYQFDTAVGDFLFAMTTPEEKAMITAACYATTTHTQGQGTQGFFDWERGWYAAHLPPAPAKLLVAGAGWGRELAALSKRGYLVSGFDPVPPTASLIPAGTTLIQGDFQGWVDAVNAGDQSSALGQLSSQRFDAVILGWGSLSHALSPALR